MLFNKRPKKRLLITGVSGMLGSNLAYYFKDKYLVLGLYNKNAVKIKGINALYCDISNCEMMMKIIQKFNPSVIIHCAAITDVDKCEMNINLAKKVNIIGTKNIAKSIKSKYTKCIYISSDAVYAGDIGNYREHDTAKPVNFYGKTKYEGELEIMKAKNALIFRTNIFGWNIKDKKSLGEWVINELKYNNSIKGFTDSYFSTIYTFELAKIIDIAIQKNLKGTYNCGSCDSCSKYEYAKKCANIFGYNEELIKPISIDKHIFRAKRGKNLSLNIRKLEKDLDIKITSIDDSVENFYKDYINGLPKKLKSNTFKYRRIRFFGQHDM